MREVLILQLVGVKFSAPPLFASIKSSLVEGDYHLITPQATQSVALQVLRQKSTWEGENSGVFIVVSFLTGEVASQDPNLQNSNDSVSFRCAMAEATWFKKKVEG